VKPEAKPGATNLATRDGFPTNFPRDISSAIKDNLIATVTARTYKISRTGWNKISMAVADLEHA
jgi:hypothetical protein